jgi:predicted regulator of amino acid metabolism with ACT domain
MIDLDSKVKAIFSKLESAGPSLRAAAKQLGLGVVEITADNPSEIGILAHASRVLAEHGISIRQALVDDPELNPEPKLTLIGDRVIPGKAIPLILKIPGVAKVSVY